MEPLRSQILQMNKIHLGMVAFITFFKHWGGSHFYGLDVSESIPIFKKMFLKTQMTLALINCGKAVCCTEIVLLSRQQDFHSPDRGSSLDNK